MYLTNMVTSVRAVINGKMGEEDPICDLGWPSYVDTLAPAL